MRVLILGGSGMLGHKLWQTIKERFETHVTFRRPVAAYANLGIFNPEHSLGGVSALDFDSVARALDTVQAQVVVNCIGVVKQDAGAKDPVVSIAVNSLFPQRLSQLCRASGTRLIHISTDCVFSGRKGNYSEADEPDALDLYGRTKLLGEVEDENSLTIRTSMVGRELAGAHGLIEWFLGQRGGQVRGFQRAVFSGFTTGALSGIIAGIISEHSELHGLWHVAADPISKFELLTLVKQAYGLDIKIEPDEAFVCDRSLNGNRFRATTGFAPPSWSEMIEQIRQDTTPYEELRRIHA